MTSSGTVRVDFRAFEPRPNAYVRLFCLPYAGAGASVFRQWQAGLPGVDVVAARLPGREGRFGEAPPPSWSALVDAAVEGLLPHLGAPYALFGHSMGAVLALAVAREVEQRRGPPPAHLIVSGRPSPDCPTRWTGAALSLADQPLIDELQRRFGDLDGTLLDDPEVRKVVLPTLRADLLLLEGARAGRAADPVSCPITVYAGSADPSTSLAELLGWQKVTREGFRIKLFPGGHFFLNQRRDALLQDIRETLAGARLS